MTAAGSYMLVGPLANFGDWAHVARTLQPPLLWIIGFTVLGWQLIVVGSRLARRPEWQPLRRETTRRATSLRRPRPHRRPVDHTIR